MNILLVGNGFDLAHGLPTSYKNFLSFVSELVNSSNGNRHAQSQTLHIHEALMPLLGEPLSVEVKEMSELVRDNVWIEYFLKINSKLGGQWIDFESEMYNVICTMDSIPPTGDGKDLYDKFGTKLSRFLETLRALEVTKANSAATLYHDLTTVRNRLLRDLETLKRSLEIYLCMCMEYVEVTKRLRLFDEAGNLDGEPIEGVLSFNYTNTFEKIYQPIMASSPEYCYIHGKARAENFVELNNMVLGIDEYLDKDERDTNTAFVAFKKYYQRIFKQTDYNYSDWLLEPETNLFVIGHSLSATDKGVLRNLILHKGVQTTIYYHNKEANAEQICHLLNVIGYEDLNNLSRGNDESRSITFSQLL